MNAVLAIIQQSWEFHPEDYQQTKLAVIVEYRRELAEASWWRRYWLYFKIEREVRRIIQSRI